MSEFDEALARAVEDGIARGGLPGATDAVRRGRRRSLRAHGGAAVLGVAALAGALGVGSAFGTGSGVNTAVAGSATKGRSASAPASSAQAHGDGLLAAELWPGYNLAHWAPRLLDMHPVTSFGSLVNRCDSKFRNLPPYLFPITGATQWGGVAYNTGYHEMASEIVLTFADEAQAAAFLADTRGAGTAPPCGTGPSTPVPSPGVSTAHGVSWAVRKQDGGEDHQPAFSHLYLVQSGNRVALLSVMWVGTDMQNAGGDGKVLADLQQALEK